MPEVRAGKDHQERPPVHGHKRHPVHPQMQRLRIPLHNEQDRAAPPEFREKMTTPRPRFLRLGLVLIHAVAGFRQHARLFYYKAALLGHTCPSCSGALRMQGDNTAVCRRCKNSIDPTASFQCCERCGGSLRRKQTHYTCSLCGAPAPSRFAFDPIRFDQAYFAQKMRESRQRHSQHIARFQERLILSRSDRQYLSEMPDARDIPGLSEALDRMAGMPLPKELIRRFLESPEFDLERYRRHVLESIGICEVLFDEIAPLLEDVRRDRIFRFVAAVYMNHEGEIELFQQDEVLVVARNEPDPEGR